MINIGLIGFGYAAKNYHWESLKSSSRFNVVSVCDVVSPDKVLIGDSVQFYKNHKEMLADNILDAVLISTPNACHFEHILDSLNAGLHVAVEKPLCLTKEQGHYIQSVAFNMNKRVLCLHHNRFKPASQKVKKIIGSGQLGKIYHISVQLYGANSIPTARHYRDSRTVGGGILYDVGSHFLDLVMWFMGYPEINSLALNVSQQVSTRISTQTESDEGGFDDFVTGSISVGSDPATSISFEMGYDTNLAVEHRKIFIFGTEASLVWPDLILFKKNDEPMHLPVDQCKRISDQQFEHFADLVLDDSLSEIVPLAESVKIVDLISRLYSSIN